MCIMRARASRVPIAHAACADHRVTPCCYAAV